MAKSSFRVARIVYFADLTRANARVIPLGSLAEVDMPHVYGLALKARSALKPAECALISPLLRERLADPFEFLRGEFTAAWESAADGGAIDFLAARHTASLSVLAPTDYPHRHWLLSRLLPVREDAVEAKLSDAVDSEFADLIKQYDSNAVAPRKVIESGEREGVAA